MFKELETKIENDVKRSISESQKEYYLREKMKSNPRRNLVKRQNVKVKIDELRKKDSVCWYGLKTIEEKALIELNRYVSMPGSSPESGVIRKYLDFMIELPWSKTIS